MQHFGHYNCQLVIHCNRITQCDQQILSLTYAWAIKK